MTKNASLSLLVVLTTTLFLGTPALASAGASVPQAAFTPTIKAAATPELRLAKWQRGVQRFMDQHPWLSGEQLQVIGDLRDLARDDRFFADRIDSEAKDVMRETFSKLENVLTPSEYRDLVIGLSSLRGWFLENNIQVDSMAMTTTCVCGGSNPGLLCANGFHCEQIGCTVRPGSLANGVCVPD